MKIAIGCDHADPGAKRDLVEVLKMAGHDVLDLGTDGPESVDYPDFAEKVARAVADGEADRGILICGTGIGMSMAANKVKGIRASVAHDEFTVRMSRRHNDANVLCLGARVIPAPRIVDLSLLFLEEPFDGGRHQRRVDKIMDIEKG